MKKFTNYSVLKKTLDFCKNIVIIHSDMQM